MRVSSRVLGFPMRLGFVLNVIAFRGDPDVGISSDILWGVGPLNVVLGCLSLQGIGRGGASLTVLTVIAL